ncbi:MAG TPA: hypothetical protein VFD04_15105 [Actinomycetes bacterium]|nr:hypothetical protein [Actinomycetes bacterium]
MSIALFATAAAIWVALLVPAVRRGRAERAAGVPSAVTLRGDPEGRVRRLPAAGRRPARRRASPAVVRRRRVLAGLLLAGMAGLRAWAALGGRWWLAPGAAAVLLVAYLAALVAAGRRRTRGGRVAIVHQLPLPAAAGWGTSGE